MPGTNFDDDSEEQQQKLSNNLTNMRKDNDIYKAESGRMERFLSQEMKALFKALREAPIVSADLFYSLYSLSPRVVDHNDNEFLESMRQMMEQVISSPQFQVLRKETMLNEEKSTAYAAAIMRELLRDLQEQLEKQAKQHDPYGYGGQQEDLKDLIKRAMQGDKYSQEELQRKMKELSESGEGDKIAQKIKDLLSKGKSGLDKEIAEMEKEEQERLAQQQGQGQGQQGQGQQGKQGQKGQGKGAGKGGADKGKGITEYQTLPVNQVKLIESLTNKLVKAMPEFSNKKISTPVGDRIAGLRRTKDISKALLRELAMPEEMLIAKAFEGWLAFDKYTSFKGAYYVLIDKSGSMDDTGGKKNIWARSVALALLEKAQAKGRKYYLRLFDDEFTERLDKPDEIKAAIKSVQSGGGTTINNAILVALGDMMNDKKLSKSSNTIILITDGEDQVSPELEQLIKQGKCKLVTIMIDGNNETLKRISDAYFTVKPNEKNALELLKEMVRKDERERKKSTNSSA
jgi:uncharacterized protein with von Willebrand factor type A (vWA) domain